MMAWPSQSSQSLGKRLSLSLWNTCWPPPLLDQWPKLLQIVEAGELGAKGYAPVSQALNQIEGGHGHPPRKSKGGHAACWVPRGIPRRRWGGWYISPGSYGPRMQGNRLWGMGSGAVVFQSAGWGGCLRGLLCGHPGFLVQGTMN